jgi:hypothetical protein
LLRRPDARSKPNADNPANANHTLDGSGTTTNELVPLADAWPLRVNQNCDSMSLRVPEIGE